MRDKNGVHSWMSIADEYEVFLMETDCRSIYGGCKNKKGELVDDHEG